MVFPSPEMGTSVRGAGGQLVWGVQAPDLDRTDGVGKARDPPGMFPASGLNWSSKLQIDWDHLQAEEEHEGSKGD